MQFPRLFVRPSSYSAAGVNVCVSLMRTLILLLQAFGQRAKDQDAANKLKRKGKATPQLMGSSGDIGWSRFIAV